MVATLISQYSWACGLVDSESGYDLAEEAPHDSIRLKFRSTSSLAQVALYQATTHQTTLRITGTAEPDHINWSVTFWAQVASGDKIMVGHSIQAAGWKIWLLEDGSIEVTYRRSGALRQTVSFAAAQVAGVLTHYTVTVVVITNLATITLFRNGVSFEVITETETVTPTLDDFDEVEITSQAVNSFTSWLGNVKIYYDELSQGQIDGDLTEQTDLGLGGTASILKVGAIRARSAIGAMGFTTLLEPYADMYNEYARLEANSRKSVEICVTGLSYQFFKGEIKDIAVKLYDAQYTIVEMANKLKTTPVLFNGSNGNPVRASGFIRYMGVDTTDDTRMFDIDQLFGDVSAGHLVTLVKQVPLDEYVCCPNHDHILYQDDGFASFVPDLRNEGADNLYYHDQSKGDSDEWSIQEASGGSDKIGISLSFDFLMESGTTIDKMTFEARHAKISGTLNGAKDSKVFIWDFTNTVWIELLNIDKADFGASDGGYALNAFGTQMGNLITTTINVDLTTITQADVILSTNLPAGGASGRFEVRFLIQSQKTNGFSKDSMAIYFSKLSMKYDTPILNPISNSVVKTIPTNGIEFDTNATSAHQPFDAGFCIGDTYYISPILSTLITEAFANSDTQFVVSQDLTLAGDETIIVDHSALSMFQFLDAVDKIANSSWWNEHDTPTIVIKSTDNLVSTGYTLVQTDAFQFFDETLLLSIGSRNMRESVLLTSELYSVSKSVSPDHGHTLGSETEIINSDNSSLASLNTEGESVALRHKHTRNKNVFPIALEVAQTMPLLRIGRTIAMKLPSVAVATIDFSGATELFLEAIEYELSEATGWDPVLFLHLRRRG